MNTLYKGDKDNNNNNNNNKSRNQVLALGARFASYLCEFPRNNLADPL